MAKNTSFLKSDDEISQADVIKLNDEDVQIISSPQQIERMSKQAKEMTEEALANRRERLLYEIDEKKLPMTLDMIESIKFDSELLNDEEVLQRVKSKIEKPSDLKYIAEAQKIKIQNLQALLKMNSIDDNTSNSSDTYFAIEFGDGSGSSTKIAVKTNK